MLLEFPIREFQGAPQAGREANRRAELDCSPKALAYPIHMVELIIEYFLPFYYVSFMMDYHPNKIRTHPTTLTKSCINYYPCLRPSKGNVSHAYYTVCNLISPWF